MRTNLIVMLVLTSLFLLYAGSTVTFAADSTYHISGHVVDVNGNGIPGAKVSLVVKGFNVLTTSGNPTTSASGANVGYYSFDLNALESSYQIIAVKDGHESSVILSTTWDVKNYTGKDVTIRNIGVLGSYVAPTPAAIVTATPAPTAAPVSATPTTPTVLASAIPTNATPATGNATVPAPTAGSTAKPAPGIVFTFIPALMVLSLLALRKRN